MVAPRFGPTTSSSLEPGFEAWCEALAERHLRELTFPEVRRALTALSAIYVEERDRLARGAALDSRGKRAAFALFYGPLHFLTVSAVLRELGAAESPLERLVDLGCGTGVGGAAWALAAGGRPAVVGADANRWAVDEARWTYSHFGLRGEARVQDAGAVRLGGRGTAVLAGWLINELAPPAQERLLGNLLAAASQGARVLVLEPIARRGRPWWPAWERAFRDAGGRTDEWRFSVALPDRLKLLDKAAGLKHDELTARTLYVARSSSGLSREA
jgi:hypothetical protein